MDFIKLDIDKAETLPARQQFNLVQRSQYALVDAEGNVIQRWFGFLDEAEVTRFLNEYLAAE
ncbi:MAG: hypothetical protein HXY41_11090 [Chloroflexi bacterium]|nr:hypothetical protein [Chloroflexota bacterium]